MKDLEIYEIDSAYIQYLTTFDEHLFRNKKITQDFSRKYVGIILEINGFKYFAPLSSYKPKHKRLCETVDFIKIGIYAVLNLNNMFPAPMNLCKNVSIKNIQNEHYRNLIRAEYRIIKQKNRANYNKCKECHEHKMINDGKSKLSQRCNDFKLLEEKCKEYKIPTKKK